MLTLIVNGEVYSPKPLGAIERGKDADLVMMRKDSLEIVEVIARGRRLVAQGRLSVEESFLKQSARTITLQGLKHKDDE